MIFYGGQRSEDKRHTFSFKHNSEFILQKPLGFIGSASGSPGGNPLHTMGTGNKLSFSISLNDPVNAVFRCSGLLPSFTHGLPKRFRTWSPPIHHFSIPLAKPGGRKNPFWNVRNSSFGVFFQDKSYSVVSVRHDP